LNWESETGKDLFKRLAKTADFIMESFPPGYLERMGLNYEVLNRINPRLIMASVTPFGQTGPFKDFKAGDLIASAMGGMVGCTGEPDRAPVRISADLAYCQAGVHAAIGLLIALSHRAATGRGQWVDVSMQASTVRTLHTQLPYWEYSNHIVHRSGIRRFRGESRHKRSGRARMGLCPGCSLEGPLGRSRCGSWWNGSKARGWQAV